MEILSEKLGKELAKKYEKEIYSLCVKTWDGETSIGNADFADHVRRIEYEKMGMLMTATTKEERSSILKDMREKKLQWESGIYDSIRSELKSIIGRRAKPMEVAEGIFKCRRCGSEKTTSIAAQLRGADEPMTNFVTCANPRCKNQWRC